MKRPKPNHNFLLMSIVCVFKRLTEFILLCYRTITVVQKICKDTSVRCNARVEKPYLITVMGFLHFFSFTAFLKSATRNLRLGMLPYASIMVQLPSDLTLNLSFIFIWDSVSVEGIVVILYHWLPFQSISLVSKGAHFKTSTEITLLGSCSDCSDFKFVLSASNRQHFQSLLKMNWLHVLTKTSSHC